MEVSFFLAFCFCVVLVVMFFRFRFTQFWPHNQLFSDWCSSGHAVCRPLADLRERDADLLQQQLVALKLVLPDLNIFSGFKLEAI